MKKLLFFLIVTLLSVMLISVPVQADVIVTGQVNYAGANRNLIYDNDRDITYLDYAKPSANWATQMSWAAGLSVTIGGDTYSDWRLPSALDSNGNLFMNNPGAGQVETGSELGHLYFIEFGDNYYNTVHIRTPFTQIGSSVFWESTEFDGGTYGCFFDFNIGSQNADFKLGRHPAIAVHPGLVTTAPEPSSLVLLVSGLVGLVLRRKRYVATHIAC
jgi:PEP-CTERM motif